MRSGPLSSFFAAAVVILCVASASPGLEKTAVRLPDHADDAWNRATTTCTVSYYNVCTGWMWVWGGFSPGSRFGIHAEACCPGGSGLHQLSGTRFHCWTGCPSGYGFTGTVEVWPADADGCPTGSSLHTQPHLATTGWNECDWTAGPVDVSAGDFVVLFDIGGASDNPVSFPSDHPATGPTGPAACGTCFPTTRLNHSYAYGTVASPVCPGSPLNDGICDSQLVWSVSLSCATGVGTSSWGQIKQLYR